jgi:outer membrane protein
MTGTVLGRVQVPIYQGGAEYSIIRQNKETLGQRRIELDVQRDLSAPPSCRPGPARGDQGADHRAQAQVTATEVALNGVREEARVGQRTTLDVLNAQQELVNARVVAGHRPARPGGGVLHTAVGGRPPLAAGPQHPTDLYDPRVHYHQCATMDCVAPDGRVPDPSSPPLQHTGCDFRSGTSGRSTFAPAAASCEC